MRVHKLQDLCNSGAKQSRVASQAVWTNSSVHPWNEIFAISLTFPNLVGKIGWRKNILPPKKKEKPRIKENTQPSFSVNSGDHTSNIGRSLSCVLANSFFSQNPKSCIRAKIRKITNPQKLNVTKHSVLVKKSVSMASAIYIMIAAICKKIFNPVRKLFDSLKIRLPFLFLSPQLLSVGSFSFSIPKRTKEDKIKHCTQTGLQIKTSNQERSQNFSRGTRMMRYENTFKP